MNKIDAIRVSTAWTDSEALKTELKVELNSIEYQAILANIDTYDTTLSYLSGIIWKYYKSYYLTTSTKERCIELLANELSGKLNYYYALINQYKEAYNKNYETIRSSENTNDRNITTSRTGFNKQATTPETIDAGAEYIDNYSTSQQKYNSSGSELGKNTFKSNISGSSKELWENINAIPKRIYEGIIGLVSKYFFYVYDDDLVPCVELTLEQAIKELNDKLNILEPKVETNSVNIKTIGGVVENLTKVTPTDIDYNDGFTLMHDTTEITGQLNKLKLGANLTYDPTTKTINATGGGGGGGGISVIELTDINGTISSTQLVEINANPQNFAFKYNEKILLFTRASSTTYKYRNNAINGTDNSVNTSSTILTIELSTGAYTIAENVHNVVANSIHPANGGDLTNIQVGSKVYSIPSGGGGGADMQKKLYRHTVILSYSWSNIRIRIVLQCINQNSSQYTKENFPFENLEKIYIAYTGTYTNTDNKSNIFPLTRIYYASFAHKVAVEYLEPHYEFNATNNSITSYTSTQTIYAVNDNIGYFNDTVVEL